MYWDSNEKYIIWYFKDNIYTRHNFLWQIEKKEKSTLYLLGSLS